MGPLKIKSMSELLKKVGLHTSAIIIDKHIIYPKTNTLDSEFAFIEEEYKYDINETIVKIKENVHKKPTGRIWNPISPVRDSVAILSILKEISDDVLLHKVDFIIICKSGVNIIKLKNTGSNLSGRSIYIEINDCRNELSGHLDKLQSIEACFIGCAIVVLIIAITCITTYNSMK